MAELKKKPSRRSVREILQVVTAESIERSVRDLAEKYR